jgi:hypothetical protein
MQWKAVLADKSLPDLPNKMDLNEKELVEMASASLL